MIELANTTPEVDVPPAEYKRLLGYPRDRVVRGRARELARWARAWYAEHGRPWVYARQAESLELADGSILVDGESFESEQLTRTLSQAQAHSVVLVAVGAGPELEHEAQIAWQQGKPDEYFFLEVLGSAVVEHLTTMVGARLCAWAEDAGMAVLPHYSPGYAEWDISQQPRLLALIRQTREHDLPGQLEVLDSGMLRPKKSMLAMFGVTHHTEHLRRITELVPCERCSYLSCQYRRQPYTRSGTDGIAASAIQMGAIQMGVVPIDAATIDTPLDQNAAYAVNAKALSRWITERLELKSHEDGTIDALFRYDGTTCTNLGHPLAYHYHVKLGPRQQRFPILEQRCSPAGDDQGYTQMCRYLSDAESLMAAIDEEKPLNGRPLNDVLSWNPPSCTAGCYCEPGDRLHKWRLVLETIHYSLVQQEKQCQSESTQQTEIS